jgi:hypothetical protein
MMYRVSVTESRHYETGIKAESLADAELKVHNMLQQQDPEEFCVLDETEYQVTAWEN